MSTANQDARLNFRLPSTIKETIEEAALQRGQTLTDFAITTLAAAARQVLDEQSVTRLSDRDRKRFLEILDDTSSKPNKALRAAAKQYRDEVVR